MKKIFLLFVFASVFIFSCTSNKEQALPVGCTSAIFYAVDIKPIIDSKCVSCHFNGGSGTGDFTVFSELKSKADNGSFKNRVFVLKDMPPALSPVLSADELTKLNCWLEQGAPNN